MERAEAAWRFGLLGTVELVVDGVSVALGPPKQRMVLAVLLCRANEVVTAGRLLDAVWEGDPPRTARKNLQVYISALRKLVGDRISFHGYGYRLRVATAELDVLRFEQLSGAGRAALRERRFGDAAGLLGDALSLWRDHALADLLDNGFAAEHSRRLAEHYVAVFEDWADAGLAADGRLAGLDQLLEVADRHPLRERLAVAAITALAREGRREAALGRYEQYRQLLSRELGLAPSPVLQQLYRALLRSGGPAPAAGLIDSSGGAHHVRPAQLPRHPADFTGRTAELDRVGAWLRGGTGWGVVLITGPTGAGKTALAVYAGQLARDRFPDGQFFVPMTDREGIARPRADLLAELMTAAGLDAAAPSREAAALALWRSWTADKAFLIVLDDAVDESCVADLLPGEGPSRMLVTSSRSLAGLDAVERVRLDGLGRAEAAAWLTHALRRAEPPGAGAASPDGDSAADLAARVIDRVGTLPLLLRAAAIALGGDVGRGRGSVDADWGDRLVRRLGAVSVGGTALRERYRRLDAGLSAQGRLALRALGRLPGTRFGPDELLAALGDAPRPGGVDALAELLDAHVLVDAHGDADEVIAHGADYAMPGLAHSYAAELAYRRRAPVFLGPLPGASGT